MKTSITLTLFILACISCAFLSSCDPKSVVKETVLANNYEADVTTIILVRHAEKSKEGKNPVLSQEGLQRAQKLADVLSEIAFDKIYSTNFKRTMQTASPIAKNQELVISNYEGFDHDKLIDDIFENANKGQILIVGHSNTTANFLNALTGTSNYLDIHEDVYDNLFIVNTKSKGDAKVIQLKF